MRRKRQSQRFCLAPVDADEERAIDAELKADPHGLDEFRERLTTNGALLPPQKLQTYYDTFRRGFGPELRALEGEQLLDRMHAHGKRDSIVHWLEFRTAVAA